mgnify:CR=1 FL=1
MKRAAFLIFVALVFAAMAIAVTLRTLADGEGDERGWGGRQTPVAVQTVAEREFADVVEALGTANANESVTITAKVSDIISRIEFDSGDQVEAGDLIVELASAEEAAGLSEARATLREARREVIRFNDLTERGVAPQSRLDEVNAGLERAQARVEAIEARVADRIIRAPFTGVLGLREVSPGELVRPGDVIARLDDTSTIKLDFTLPERFLSVIEPGIEVQARAAAFDEEVFDGQIAQIDSRVDPATRAVTVRALVDNADGRLRPGMLMTVKVRRDIRSAPAIPEAAVSRLRDQTFVYVIEAGEQGPVAKQREVRLGQRDAGMFEVLAGLEPADQVVAEGVHRVRPGAPVRISEERGVSGGEGEGPALASPGATSGDA